MALDFKRIMLVTRNVQFAIGLKRALEGLGEYSVTTVVAVRNAIEELSDEPQQLVLLDTANLAISPAIMIEMIRSRQRDIAIILSPDSADNQALARAYQLSAVVNIPASARSLLPIFEAALHARAAAGPPRPAAAPPLEGELDEDTVPIEALVDDFLDEESTSSYTYRRLQASYELLNPPPETEAAADSLEILIPPEEELDTIRYRYVQADDLEESTTSPWRGAAAADSPAAEASDSETLRDLAELLAAQRPAHSEAFEAALNPSLAPETALNLQDSTAFQELLNKLLDESTLLHDFRLESLFDTTQKLLSAAEEETDPGWAQLAAEILRADRPPEALSPAPAAAAETLRSAPPPQAAETILAASPEAEAETIRSAPPPHAAETLLSASPEAESETIRSAAPAPPAETSLPASPEAEAETIRSAPPPAAETVLAASSESETLQSATPSETEPAAGRPPPASELGDEIPSRRADDPLRAQLALAMTQTMGELTAAATLLTRADNIVAFSGSMTLEDLRALRGCIGDDWSAQRDHSRIRFIKLPAGADYMLYSRGTVADYTLTMVFSGGKQLREIRRQADHMLSALAAVPEQRPAEPLPAAEAPAAATPATHQPFAFVWLLADAAQSLRKNVAQQLVFWLELHLNSLNWKIHRLDVHQDFISLYADAPAAPPEKLIRTVMESSRQIARAEDAGLPAELWADAYLVLQPGREISESELRRFLQFARD